MDKGRWVGRLLPLAVGAALGAACLGNLYKLSPQVLAQTAPQGGGRMAAWVLLLFAAKSLSVVLPILVLQALCGLLFPLPAALAVSVGGTAVSMLVGYAMGRGLRGQGSASPPRRQGGRWRRRFTALRGRPALAACLARAAGIPLDWGSMAMGALRLPLAPYLAGSLVGAMPGAVLATLLGVSVTQPGSGAFFAALGGNLAVAGASLLALRRMEGPRGDLEGT